jgi:putative transcriptional regulator
MSTVKSIRDTLGVTQSALAAGMGCTQGNVGHYERGQTVPPEAAKRLIAYAQSLGHVVTYEDIYGAATPTQIA